MAGQSSRLFLRVIVTDGRGHRISPNGLAVWLSRLAPVSSRVEITVALVGDQQIKKLNRRFRGLDQVTDVLSFSMESSVPDPCVRKNDSRYLGDVVIAIGVATRQALAVGHSFTTEVRLLALHGLLHLLGYDHVRGARDIDRIEKRLLRKSCVAKCPAARSPGRVRVSAVGSKNE